MKLRVLLLGLVLPLPYQGQFQQIDGVRYVDRISQAYQESGLNPKAQSFIINKAGQRVPCAWGLCQFTLPTWGQWGKPKGVDVFDVTAQINAQQRYMNYLEASLDNDYDKSLGAYNAGKGSIQKAIWLQNQLGLQTWQEALPHITGVANAKQTTTYIARIHQWQKQISFQQRFNPLIAR